MADTYQIVLTKEAKRDINDILDYLLEEVSFKEASDARQKILEAIRSLDRMPEAQRANCF